ncbi:MAG: hypothetical protein JNM78_05825 [Cyclobacteriaceae bacterium]|nr:hypothetical protein [Cyclobacteriaceae bacterium]
MNRHLLSLVLALFCFCQLLAQTPKGINYQGVARDNEGKPIMTKSISVRIGIIKNSASGEVEYSEIHRPQTNQFGLFTLIIGQGTPSIGSFAFVSWAIGNKWLQIEIDPNGGNSFQLAGSQQLMSVPYALYSEYSGNINTYSSGQGIAITDGVISNTGDHDNSVTNELITEATLTTDKKLRITDAGGTKEVDLTILAVDNQSLTLTGTSLSISGGNSVNLGTVNTDNQNLSAGASAGTTRTINITNGSSVTFDVADIDNSITNELQTLTKSGATISLSNGGGSVILGDDNSTNEIQDLALNTSTNILSLTSDATTVDLTPYKQNLTYTPATNNLAISGGNNVTISSTLTQILTTNPSAGNFRIQNVGSPIDPTDATTKGYVDNALASTFAFKANFVYTNTTTGFINNQDMPFTSEVFDTFNVISGTTFTASEAGTYIFIVDGTYATAIAGGQLSILYNTIKYPITIILPFGATVPRYNATFMFQMTVGQTIKLVGDNIPVSASFNGQFFGYKL